LSGIAQIIVEQQNSDHWMAWFKGVPEVSVSGELPADEIWRLMTMVRTDELEVEEIVANVR
jgi:hypothetical protein